MKNNNLKINNIKIIDYNEKLLGNYFNYNKFKNLIHTKNHSNDKIELIFEEGNNIDV